jgi:hypothetical protein
VSGIRQGFQEAAWGRSHLSGEAWEHRQLLQVPSGIIPNLRHAGVVPAGLNYPRAGSCLRHQVASQPPAGRYSSRRHLDPLASFPGIWPLSFHCPKVQSSIGQPDKRCRWRNTLPGPERRAGRPAPARTAAAQRWEAKVPGLTPSKRRRWARARPHTFLTLSTVRPIPSGQPAAGSQQFARRPSVLSLVRIMRLMRNY